jgi:molecular chaperone GrpE
LSEEEKKENILDEEFESYSSGEDLEQDTEESETKDLEVDMDALIDMKVQERVAELEDLRLRDLAEFQNITKRLEKEKFQSIAYAQEGFARDLLAVIDSLDNASAAIDSQTEANLDQIKEGIELTLTQFKKVFDKHGIELIEVENGFDPNFHEAMMKVDSEEHQEGDIVQIFQKGYKMKDRVIRPAMVSVAK